MNKRETHLAMRTSVVTMSVQILLSAFKMAAGIVARSSAMISDAVHSISDVLTTVIVMAGIKMSSKESDREHPFGHERLECVAALILAIILAGTGLGIGIGAVRKMISGEYGILADASAIALAAAIASIITQECLYHYTKRTAKKIGSGAMLADAWHHRTDAFSSVGSLIGILGAAYGFPMLDSIAAIVIALFVVKTAVSIFRDSIHKMTDVACDENTQIKLTESIEKQEGVLGIKKMRTRIFGTKIYVEVEIYAAGTLTLNETDRIAVCVHDRIESEFDNIKHCLVRVSPLPSESVDGP